MIRWATIVAKSPQWVELTLIQKNPCRGCHGQCHRPLFKLFSVQGERFSIYRQQPGMDLNNSHLLFGDESNVRQIGQQVGLEIHDGDMLLGGFQFYVWPLLVMLIAMAVGHYAAVLLKQPTDLWTFIGMVVALIWALLRYRLKPRSAASALPKVTIL